MLHIRTRFYITKKTILERYNNIMKKYIVDRFEGKYAICEDEKNILVSINKSNLPSDTKEGDCLIMKDDGEFYIDFDETNARIQDIRKKLNNLFE